MDTNAAIRTLWDYLRLGVEPVPADIIFVLGNNDFRCAERAAELWRAGYAPWVVISGATGRSTAGVFQKSEAELFGEVAREHGVPDSALILETGATNTGENVRNTRALLAARGIVPKRILAVQKPYMERRTLATLTLHWPGPELSVTSPRLDFAAYCTPGFPRSEVVAMMVGDAQRIIEYPKRGWQAAQPVPPEVPRAIRVLAAAGYDAQLIPGCPLP